MRRYNFTVTYKEYQLKGVWGMPSIVTKKKRVKEYADSKEEAIKQLETKGYKVVEQ